MSGNKKITKRTCPKCFREVVENNPTLLGWLIAYFSSLLLAAFVFDIVEIILMAAIIFSLMRIYEQFFKILKKNQRT